MNDRDLARDALTKVPAVTLGFWIIKILATTLGETGGDSVSMEDLPFEIGETAHALRRAFDRRAAALGVTRAQWKVLFRLTRTPGLRQVELADMRPRRLPPCRPSCPCGAATRKPR